MPQIIALTCPVCGAPLKPGDEKCGFCGSYIVIKSDLPKLDRHTLNQSVIQEHIADFRRRIRSNQYDEGAHYGLGVAYFNLGLTNEAVDELSQAARLMPENPHIQAQLAVALRDSFKAGNQSAEQQMNTRIQNALLLDPNHVEATMLKFELLLDKHQFGDAIKLYQSMSAVDQERAKQKLVSALESQCGQRLGSERWNDARWCWDSLEPIDSSAARRLALQFLNLHASLVPRVFRQQVTLKQAKGRSPSRSGPTKVRRFLRTTVVAIIALFVGLMLFGVVASVLPENESGVVEDGWPTVIILVSFFLMLGSPFIGIALSRRRGKSTPAVETQSQTDTEAHSLPIATPAANRKHFKREEILLGMVDMATIRQVVEVVIEKLDHQKKERIKAQAALDARKK